MVDVSEEDLVRALLEAGWDPNKVLPAQVPRVVVEANRVLSLRGCPGLKVRAEPTTEGVIVEIVVEDGAKIEHPVHLCFGFLRREGRQVIRSRVRVGRGARVRFISHCFFPAARKVEHLMSMQLEALEGSTVEYLDEHYHGEQGGAYVVSKVSAALETGAAFVGRFSLRYGRVGRLRVEYDAKEAAGSKVELLTKVRGKGDDVIEIREHAVLAGERASALLKTRTALLEKARARVENVVEGLAAHASGHIDCKEIVMGEARAEAVPIAIVSHPLARVTHEAAIGSISRKELETLMARGLTEEEAVDVIVRGLLR